MSGDIRPYVDKLKLPVTYDSSGVGMIRDAEGKPVISNIRYWGWLKGIEESADTFGYWIASMINNEIDSL